MNNIEFQAHSEKVERLVERVTALQDDQARTMALDLLQAVMDLHGAGLTRIVDMLRESGEAGRKPLLIIAGDPLVCGLLVLYGIHPVPLPQRVTDAIEKVRPQVHKQGGKVELLEVAADAVRISIHSSGSGCHSSPEALQRLVEQTIREAAPEVAEIISEGVAPGTGHFVPVNMIQPAM